MTGAYMKDRPTGDGLRNVLAAMEEIGFPGLPSTGFDKIEVPREAGPHFTFESEVMVRRWCEEFLFIEVKTCTQIRADESFGNFLFSFPETEIRAAELLGDRYVVILYNKLTEKTLRTSIPELIARTSSTAWQLTLQLSPDPSRKATAAVDDAFDIFTLGFG